jgi:cation:H+ antiporter
VALAGCPKELALVWVKFILCVLIIFFSGRAVARYGDIIARRTGLGGIWIGVVLLALVTSLPELFTGISAVTLVGAPDLTIGNLFGANAFNLLNLALLDIVYRNGSLLAAVSPVQRLTGWLSMALVLVAAVSIFISSHFSSMGIGWIGWYTPIIILLYLVFMWRIFRSQQRQPPPQAADQIAESDYGEIPMDRVYLYFAISAAFIIGAGIWLAIIGDEIATVTGWEESFVGSLLIGFTTTLPEITVSFAAMRMGAVDMAVANMIGSNLFNMTVIPIDDLLYLKGPVLASVSVNHLLTASIVVVMTGIFIAGLRFKPKRFLRLSWYNLTLIALFLLQAYLGYTLA